MKVYTCTQFKGHNPVGSAAVVVAPSKFMAVIVLEHELAKCGLHQKIPQGMLKEMPMDKENAVILCDGGY